MLVEVTIINPSRTFKKRVKGFAMTNYPTVAHVALASREALRLACKRYKLKQTRKTPRIFPLPSVTDTVTHSGNGNAHGEGLPKPRRYAAVCSAVLALLLFGGCKTAPPPVSAGPPPLPVVAAPRARKMAKLEAPVVKAFVSPAVVIVYPSTKEGTNFYFAIDLSWTNGFLIQEKRPDWPSWVNLGSSLNTWKQTNISVINATPGLQTEYRLLRLTP